jgi:hypothetical protein
MQSPHCRRARRRLAIKKTPAYMNIPISNKIWKDFTDNSVFLLAILVSILVRAIIKTKNLNARIVKIKTI